MALFHRCLNILQCCIICWC